MTAVAIQGEAGSFSHAAALDTHGPNLRLVPCATFDELFAAVATGSAARGVVPIENTLAGSVYENYDLLSAHNLHVIGETQVWTITNTIDFAHPFHLHGFFFQVLSPSGSLDNVEWKDTVNVPVDGTVQLPFDPRTGVIRPEVWQRWLDWDPVRMIPKHSGALRGLRAIWIDAGVRDEWFLDIGAEAVHAALRAAGVPADRIRFELFEASHMAIDYRYPMSLAWLCHQITP